MKYKNGLEALEALKTAMDSGTLTEWVDEYLADRFTPATGHGGRDIFIPLPRTVTYPDPTGQDYVSSRFINFWPAHPQFNTYRAALGGQHGDHPVATYDVFLPSEAADKVALALLDKQVPHKGQTLREYLRATPDASMVVFGRWDVTGTVRAAL